MITRIFFALIGLLVIFYVYNRVKKNLFSEKESMFWMLGAVVVFILSIFPKVIDQFSRILGIEYPPSLLFLCAMMFILILLLRQGQQISILTNNVKELIQRNALLEQKIMEVCEKNEQD
ncbi:hypothetical protein SAMN04488542_13314 [Fontibacillus panacisegetis]|uniref:DUF2304 domain-containing protein n=1 Tax=Fontibacillus panacisegetis TaxID=670482 RepID=A0A1G7SZK0_9BACL|nr:DUF2304 domain-containing protein [Fontibacillus panacisegetis]SDG28302.1 hypothetical protein SAMN04488542_13314 [Fontibacillus panacisegetis]